MAKPNYYLQNATLLEQIHKSKLTYCSEAEPKYQSFDLIVDSLDEVTPDKLEQAATRKATLEFKRLRKEARDKGWKIHEARYNAIETPTYSSDQMVIRVMTWDHIPKLERDPKKAAPKAIKHHHEPVNFIPFKHYVPTEDGFREVLRSHWKGDIETGHFSADHGKITNTLGKCFLMLSQRYGSRGNWRGYSYVEEMKGEALVNLVNHGLMFNEAKSSNPFAYYTAACSNSFTKILNAERRMQDARDDLLEEAGVRASTTRQLKNTGW